MSKFFFFFEVFPKLLQLVECHRRLALNVKLLQECIQEKRRHTGSKLINQHFDECLWCKVVLKTAKTLNFIKKKHFYLLGLTEKKYFFYIIGNSSLISRNSCKKKKKQLSCPSDPHWRILFCYHEPLLHTSNINQGYIFCVICQQNATPFHLHYYSFPTPFTPPFNSHSFSLPTPFQGNVENHTFLV